MLVGRIQSIHRYPVKSMGGEDLDAADVGRAGVAFDRMFALRDLTAREIRGAKKWPVLMQCAASYDGDPARSPRPIVTMTLPDGSTMKSSDPDCDDRLSRVIGKPVSMCFVEPASNKAHYRRAQPGASILGVLARSTTFRRMLPTLARATPAGDELRQDFGRERGEPMPDLSVLPAELIEFVSPLGTYFDAFPIHFVTTRELAEMQRNHPESNFSARRFRPNFVLDTLGDDVPRGRTALEGRTLRIGDATITCTVPTPRCSMVTQAQTGLARDTAVLRAIVREAEQMFGMYARVERPGPVRVGDPVYLE